MHHFYYLAVFPVTALAVAGYVTLYCAKNSEGRMRTGGRILSAWAFVLAIIVAAMAIIHPAVGDRHAGYFHEMENDAGAPAPGAPSDQSAPTQTPAADTPAPPTSAPDGGGSNGNGWKTN